MKKILLFVILITTTTLFAQETKEVYCHVSPGMGTSWFGNDCTISVDFGQAKKITQPQIVVDEMGEPIVFNSIIDALNWMSSLGWRFKQAFTITDPLSKDNIYHYLLAKEIQEGEAIAAGIRLYDKKGKPSESALLELAKREENKAYIALLIKLHKLNDAYKEEAAKLFPMDILSEYLQNKSVNELETLSRYHHQYFDDYKSFR